MLQASETEILWVLRISILLVGAAATTLAIIVHTIYGLWYLCADLVYVILFPQLLCVVYMPASNSYGSLAGFVTGVFFRLTGGEPLLSLPPLIEYPWFDADSGYQLFPFKTLSMAICFVSIVIGSYVAHALFDCDVLPPGADILSGFNRDEDDAMITDKEANEKDNLSYNDSDHPTTTHL